jgi:para-aminobenzoate synthetase component 1
VVEGRLADDHDVWDLLAATLPAGSITGAPKRRAMEILSEVEPHPRGVYTGAVGLLDFTGQAVLNVAIRTVRIKGDRGLLGVGGGIVADSDPDAEHREAMDKARAFFLDPIPGGGRP